eukprot:gene16049-22185_t
MYAQLSRALEQLGVDELLWRALPQGDEVCVFRADMNSVLETVQMWGILDDEDEPLPEHQPGHERSLWTPSTLKQRSGGKAGNAGISEHAYKDELLLDPLQSSKRLLGVDIGFDPFIHTQVSE